MKFLRYWIPFIAIAALIFGLSSLPSNQVSGMFLWLRHFPRGIAENSDKIAHGFIYALLCGSLLRALVFGSSLRLLRGCAVALVFCAAYGAGDEWHQTFVLGRSCDALDWLADVAGSLLAILLLYWPYRLKMRMPSMVSAD